MKISDDFVNGSTTALPTVRGHQPRVLVVDDEDDIRETVADVLAAEGYDVQTATNGLEALKSVGRHPVDLVLVDLMMPVMDGWRFQTLLHADPNTASVQVMAVSASWDGVRRPGFAAYLAKPFNLTQLLTMVGELCGSH